MYKVVGLVKITASSVICIEVNNLTLLKNWVDLPN